MNNISLPHEHNKNSEKLLRSMPGEANAQKIAETFKLISDGTRLRVLYLLCHSEECVNNIAAAAEMSAPAVSHHLRVLKQAGILSTRREGKEVYYKLADSVYAGIVHQVIDIVFDCKCTNCSNPNTECLGCKI